MNLYNHILLGIIQGLTEFLPISSSGHLVLAQYFLNVQNKGVLLEIVLHMGTLMSILIYYKSDLLEMSKKIISNDPEIRSYFFNLIIASIPIFCVGFILSNSIESLFTVSNVIKLLFVNGCILGTTYFLTNNNNKQITLFIALIIGIFQIFALLPGISRSGITISVAILMGIKTENAIKFSFFMAIPVLIGAGIYQILEVQSLIFSNIFSLFMGFLFSTITGYYVIAWLVLLISKGKFYYFSFYCFLISIISFLFMNL